MLAAIKEQTSQIQALGIRVGEAESRIAHVEGKTESLQGKVETRWNDLLEHIDDLNNRGRRCNIRVVGLTEGSEGSDSFFNDCSAALLRKRKAFQYMKELLKKMYVDDALIYPAILRMMINGAVKKFDTLSGASAFLKVPERLIRIMTILVFHPHVPIH